MSEGRILAAVAAYAGLHFVVSALWYRFFGSKEPCDPEWQDKFTRMRCGQIFRHRTDDVIRCPACERRTEDLFRALWWPVTVVLLMVCSTFTSTMSRLRSVWQQMANDPERWRRK